MLRLQILFQHEAYRPYWSPEYISLKPDATHTHTNVHDWRCSLSFPKVDNVCWRTNADNKGSADTDQRKMIAQCTSNWIYICF